MVVGEVGTSNLRRRKPADLQSAPFATRDTPPDGTAAHTAGGPRALYGWLSKPSQSKMGSNPARQLDARRLRRPAATAATRRVAVNETCKKCLQFNA